MIFLKIHFQRARLKGNSKYTDIYMVSRMKQPMNQVSLTLIRLRLDHFLFIQKVLKQLVTI
jgi:hypothetical protein